MSSIEKVLLELDYTEFDTKNQLYRYLESQGLGTFGMFKSRYRRNTDSFEDLVDVFMAGKLEASEEAFEFSISSSDTQTVPIVGIPYPSVDDIIEHETVADFLEDEDAVDEYLEQRRKLFDKKVEKNNQLTAPRMLTIDEPWFVVVGTSDFHADDAGANLPVLLDMVDAFNKYPARYLNLGDDNNHWSSVGMFGLPMTTGSETTPDDGMKAIGIILQRFGDKLVASLRGNHDHWLKKTGYDPMREVYRKFTPHCIYNDHYIILNMQSSVDENVSFGWTMLSHKGKGRSMYSEHHPNVKLFIDSQYALDRVMSGHYHHRSAAVAQFPRIRGNVESIVLSSIKSADEYARQLHIPNEPTLNPFSFTFCTPDGNLTITNTKQALAYAEMCERKYG